MKQFLWFGRLLARPAEIADVVQGGLVTAAIVSGRWVLTILLGFVWISRLVSTRG